MADLEFPVGGRANPKFFTILSDNLMKSDKIGSVETAERGRGAPRMDPLMKIVRYCCALGEVKPLIFAAIKYEQHIDLSKPWVYFSKEFPLITPRECE